MRVGVDIMGGDLAPLEAVKGCIQAQAELKDVKTVLVGPKEIAEKTLLELGASVSDFEIGDAPEVITMSEHPTKAVSQKKHSSIVIGLNLLKEHQIDAFVGAGNTGAMMIGAMFTVKPIEGIIRPTITSVLPKVKGDLGVLLDVGANADCKPDVLLQFAILGSLFAKNVYGINDPKVGLLNIGEEKEKGNLVTQVAHQQMIDSGQFNFIGNVEGRDLFNEKADVIVCDGYTGNIVLKACESIFYTLHKRGVEDDYLGRFNYENYGGTPILGVNEPVIIGHGISKAGSFVKMIKMGMDVKSSGLIEQIKSSF